MSNNSNEARIDLVLAEIKTELMKATQRFPPFRSAHEGFAIVDEEHDEFKQAVYHGTGAEAYQEGMQLATMAARYMLDIGQQGREQPTDYTNNQYSHTIEVDIDETTGRKIDTICQQIKNVFAIGIKQVTILEDGAVLGVINADGTHTITDSLFQRLFS